MKKRFTNTLTLVLVLLIIGIVDWTIRPSLLAETNSDYLDWKQQDSSWTGIHLGNSCYTIGGSGCLVTAIAIALYDLGYTEERAFTPGVLVNKLNQAGGFTAGGELYWGKLSKAVPGASTTNYSGNSISTIRKNLSGGNRIVVNISNRGHWVYVRSVSTDGKILTVSDPGYSNSTHSINEVSNIIVVSYGNTSSLHTPTNTPAPIKKPTPTPTPASKPTLAPTDTAINSSSIAPVYSISDSSSGVPSILSDSNESILSQESSEKNANNNTATGNKTATGIGLTIILSALLTLSIVALSLKKLKIF